MGATDSEAGPRESCCFRARELAALGSWLLSRESATLALGSRLLSGVGYSRVREQLAL